MPARGQGKRQRLADTPPLDDVVETVEHASLFECDSAKSLIQAWAGCEMSAVKVQFWAHQTYLTLQKTLESLGHTVAHIPGPLKELAALGNWGRKPGNAARHLRSYLGEPTSQPKPQYVGIDVKVLKPFPKLGLANIPFYFPHIVIADMYENDVQEFSDFMFGGKANRLEDFWAEVQAREDPRIASHPMCRRADWKKFAVPVMLHGDDVPVTKVGKAGSVSLHNCSWQPLFAEGRSLYIKRLITQILRVSMTDATEGQIWHKISWSLMWLFRGIHPDSDWNGKAWPAGSSQHYLGKNKAQLAGGYFFVVWGLQQDLDYSLKTYKMKSYNANDPCDSCPCHKASPNPKMIPTYFGHDAQWMKMLYTPQQWRELNPDMHVLFRTFSFLSSHNLEPDEMHILYLGVYKRHLGSVLWLLVHRLMSHDPAENMRDLWTTILYEYSRIPPCNQFTSLNLGSFSNAERPRKEYPNLKGSASEIKWIIGPISSAWAKYKRPGNRFDNRVLATLRGMLEIRNLVDEAARDAFMEIPKAMALREKIHEWLNLHVWLANEVDKPVPHPDSLFEPGDKLFAVVPKSHWMWHFGQRAYWLSPRRGACYAGEDFQRLLKNIARTSSAGCAAHLIPRTMSIKYRWAVHFEILLAKHSRR